MGVTLIGMNGNEFPCNQCGSCCKSEGAVNVTLYDIFRIAEHLGMTPEEFRARYCKKNTPRGKFPDFSFRAKDDVCPFFENGCTIYDARPLICHVYPISMPYLKTVGELRGYGQKIHPGCALASMTDDTQVEPDFELYLAMCAHTAVTEEYFRKYKGIMNKHAAATVEAGKQLIESEKFREYCKKRYSQ